MSPISISIVVADILVDTTPIVSTGNKNKSMKISGGGKMTVKSKENLPIRSPNPDLDKIIAHTKFGESSSTFTQSGNKNTDKRTFSVKP